MYCCKPCSKHSERLGTRAALCDVVDGMARKDQRANEEILLSEEQLIGMQRGVIGR